MSIGKQYKDFLGCDLANTDDLIKEKDTGNLRNNAVCRAHHIDHLPLSNLNTFPLAYTLRDHSHSDLIQRSGFANNKSIQNQGEIIKKFNKLSVDLYSVTQHKKKLKKES